MYCNALISRAWRYLADLEKKLGRSEQQAQVPGAFQVHDILSSEHIAITNRSFPLEVPAGLLRILEVNSP